MGDGFMTEAFVFVHNSVVCVGGDGMFSEIMHGMIGRTQQEAGLSENDLNVTLQPCHLHIGIIPAGNVVHIKHLFTRTLTIQDVSKGS